MEAKLRTSGFQFLYYNFYNKRINLDLSQVENQNGDFILSEDALKKQMERQLSQNISLLDLDRDQLSVDLYQVSSKEVGIKPNLDIQFAQNYILDGQPIIEPEAVLVKGPKNEIDTLTAIYTTKIEMTNVSSDFSKDASLVFPKELVNSIFSISRAKVSGKVVKFSEKVFEVPVQVINLPEGYQVKTFPNSMSVLCKATIDQLKSLSANDFAVVADYKQLSSSNENVLFLEISQKPEKAYDVRLLENKVNFVLEQQ